MQSTLIMLAGGHRITVKGMTPADVDHAIREHLDPARPTHDESHMLYLQQFGAADNSIVIDPRQVVALIRLPTRSEVKPNLTGSARMQPLLPSSNAERERIVREAVEELGPLPPSVYDGQ